MHQHRDWTIGDDITEHPRYEDHVNLELEMRDGGIENFDRRVTAAVTKKKVASLDPHRAAIRRWVPTVAEAVKDFTRRAKLYRKKAEILSPSSLIYLEALDPYMAALLTLRAIMDRMASGKTQVLGLSRAIGEALENEARMEAWEKQEPELYYWNEKALAEDGATTVHRRRVNIAKLNNLKASGKLDWEEWPRDHVKRLGTDLLNIAMHSTGAFRAEDDIENSFIPGKPRSPTKLLVMDEKVLDKLTSQLGQMRITSPVFHRPAIVSETASPWGEIVGFVDTAGKATDNSDETSLGIVAEHHGQLGLLFNAGWMDGFSPGTLRAIAKALVRWNVGKCFIETNFGDGMFLALLQPYVEAEWALANKARRKDEHGGTSLEETRAVMVQKEHRILSVLEPLTAQHRLMVNREVIEEDYRGIKKLEGEETRHRYALFYQYTHLTREKDALAHDDRLDAVSGACAYFAPMLGVNPLGMAARRDEERIAAELEELFSDADDVAQFGRRRPGSGRSGRLKAAPGRLS